MHKNLLIDLDEFKEAEKYWLAKLSGELNEVRLLRDFAETKQYEKGNFNIQVENHLTEELLKIAKNNELSLYIILLTAFKVLISRYTGQEDIVVVSPIYTPSNEKYNKYVVLRDFIDVHLTFKEQVINVRETVVEGYKNEHYSFSHLTGLLDIDDDVSFSRIVLLLDTIHKTEFITGNIEELGNDFVLSILEKPGQLELEMIYNSKLFKRETVQKLVNVYLYVLEQVLNNIDINIADIELMTAAEKKEILSRFNETWQEFPGPKTIRELFERQVVKTPDNTAISSSIDLSDIFAELESETVNINLFKKIGKCCFKKNPYIFEFDLEYPDEKGSYKTLKTHRHNSVVVNHNMLKLLGLFNGKRNIKSIFSSLKDINLTFIIYALNTQDILEISYEFNEKPGIFSNQTFESFIHLVKSMYRHHLVEIVDFNSTEAGFEFELPMGEYFDENEPINNQIPLNRLLNQNRELSSAPVLLLGDTPGMQTVGLLYLASYLKRHGIKSYCQFYNTSWDYESLKSNIESLLEKIKPQIAAVSMKWFPHIARVVEMCRIIKEYAAGKWNSDIKVVVGGNTASYYREEIIQYDCVDYVILGDGEVPLLEICRDRDYIPNCVYKRDGKIIENPIDYVENETNSREIYLSHLDELMISDFAPLIGTFFIYTHKGCDMNCLYCGGCKEANKKVFNRHSMFKRRVEEVRKDIIEVKKYTSTFLFDFDAPNYKLLDYCKKIWEGIDLSSHFCIFTNLVPPSPEIIEVVNKTFRYVYWNLDIASLSQRHREQLVLLNLVKPQPRDEEILAIFNECEKYDNAEVRLNLIAGLPYFNREDIVHSDRMLSFILSRCTCASELHWARLHAQPGAPVAKNAGKYDMFSLASTFEDFLKYSRMGFSSVYNVEYYNYPYIYFNDEESNSKISNFYSDTNAKIGQYKEHKRKNTTYIFNELTYQELNERSNQLARALTEKGVQTNTIVGLMIRDSMEQAVGMLGVLKAGGAYLPLDADYPLNLKAHILKDSNMWLLLTEDPLPDDLAGTVSQALVVTLDDMEMAEFPGSEPEPLNGPSDPAYVIYTSGTTGKPKGTLVEQKGLVNYTRWRIETYQCTEEDVALQPLSYCFDGYGSNFYSTLLSGGNLYIVPAAKRADPEYTRKAIRTNRVTNISLVPGLYRMILETAEAEELESLRFVVLAGDISGEYLIRESKKKAPHIQLFNEYGPTEATVTAVGGSRIGPSNTSLVGKPIANTRIYVLDGSLEPAPLYAGGELCISGEGLARGYLNNPELTREKFIENPFEEGRRLYRTGDLARWLPGGNLEFLGRIDQQVKIRGFRMELAEIENRLSRHKDIKETAVIALEGPEDKYLCAYCVSGDEEEKFDAAELKEFLAGELPDYMIPLHFIWVESIPLTRNGKVDRRALPAPELKPGKSYAAPTNEIERKLVEIWSEALGVEKQDIGLDSDFFHLGGHSLKGAIITAKIQKKLDVDVPLAEIFRKPTIRALANYIGGAAGAGYVSIEPAEEKEYYPLSPAQKRLYVLMQMDENSTAYNSPQIFKLEKGLDRERFKDTLAKIIQRHESFRTSFEMVEGEAVQRIHPGVEPAIEYNDACSMSIIEDFARPFDLERAPLFRIELGKIGEKQNILLLDFHHIITDGVSHQLFITEFMRLYAGEELPPLRLRYKDYSQWRHTDKQTEEIKKQENYWLGEFPGEIPVLNLPTDYTRPVFQEFAGSTIGFSIDEQSSRALKNLAAREASTLFMLLLAIFDVLLYKLGGQEDIVVGTPVAGRRHADLENIIGIFINTLALRNYPSGEKTFTEFCRDVRARALRAFENQEYPFETLVDNIAVNRDTSRNPLFDVMFAMQNVEAAKINMSQWKVEPYEYDAGISKFDMSLSAGESGEQLHLVCEYRTELFKNETIDRFIRYFKEIVSSVLEAPEKKITDIEIIPGEERRQLLEEFNNTKDEFPGRKVKTIHELFEEQAARTPDHVALVGKEQKTGALVQLTYKELNRKSNQLAHVLTGKGVTHDIIVGLMVRRSIEMMVGILGILKAGAAYLPIDPEYPEDRINYMLKDSNVNVLLSAPAAQVKVEAEVKEKEEPIEIIDISKDFSSSTLTLTSTSTSSKVSSANLAYVIYTSGSTGKPKGVMINHENVVNFIRGMVKKIDFLPGKTILALTTICFDIFVLETLLPLVKGLKVVIADERQQMDPDALEDVIIKNNVLMLQFTPSRLKLLLSSKEEPVCLQGVTELMVGGEAFTPDLFAALNERFSDKIYNLYGPTETTVWSSLKDLTGKENLDIGGPISNTRAYIPDKFNALQPMGVSGELCIAGDGVARGYINNPESTAEKFVGGPFEKGGRMYRTGDLARWRPDGNIECLGRQDNQVKIRGFRIELEEIESQLLEHESIKDAAVIAKKNKDGELYLCAFLVPEKHTDPGELREFLAGRLPLYQVPAHLIYLGKMPLTNNGKVDRKALAAVSVDSMTGSGDEYDIPMGEVEEILVEKWQEVLGMQTVSVRDNFFEIGGNSIKAIQVSARLKAHNLKLGIKDLFLNPTIRDLAPHVKKVDRDIDQGIVTGEIPLTPIQHGFFENNFTGSFHFNHAVLLYNENGFDKDIIEKVFTKIVEHHDALRIVFEKKGDKIVQRNRGIHGILFHLQVLNIMETSREECKKVIEKECSRLQRSISLDTGPLIKLGLFKTPGGDHLLIIIHHLLVDGISWRILMEDFTTGCQQALNNEEIKFPDKTDSFKYWASRLVEYSGTRKALRELSYWQNIEEQKVPKLPGDHEIDEENRKQKDVENLYLELHKEDTTRLLRDVNRAYNTEINDILLAALAMSIKQWANTGKILISLEGHGRENIMEDVDISRTVGWFTSMYPVLFDMTCCRDTDTAACIKSVKETLRKVPNKGIGCGILRYLTPQEKDKKSTFTLQSNPEISFNYLGQFQQDNEIGFARPSQVKTGESISPEKEWKYTVDINGMIAGEKLSLTFTYNTCEYDRHTIQRLIDGYRSNLEEIIRHCSRKEESEFTPGDFTKHDMDIEELEDVLEMVDGI